jgi:PAS domain-containing protein
VRRIISWRVTLIAIRCRAHCAKRWSARLSEDALYVEKERAVVTLNSIGDAVLCTDISGHITYRNLVAEAMTGWHREEATGKPLAEVFRIIDGPTRKTARDPW